MSHNNSYPGKTLNSGPHGTETKILLIVI